MNKLSLLKQDLINTVLKDLKDEFFPDRFRMFDNRHAVVRWSAYLFAMAAILLTGVFGADQFIYANF